jgi:hypothetical protein
MKTTLILATLVLAGCAGQRRGGGNPDDLAAALNNFHAGMQQPNPYYVPPQTTVVYTPMPVVNYPAPIIPQRPIAAPSQQLRYIP